MAISQTLGIVDTLIGFPHGDLQQAYEYVNTHTAAQSQKELELPHEYMFKDVPEKLLSGVEDPVAVTLAEMDRWGIEKGLIEVAERGDDGDVALTRYPDRFIGSVSIDPNEGMDGIRRIQHAHETWGVRAVALLPAATSPPVGISHRKMYPIYAKCVELGLPVFCVAGVPGPRVRMATQHVEMIDDVMYDFPELVFVTRHGCEPWEALAVKLMLKWPGLHFSTSGFAPKYYPRAVIDYANTRGANKLIYAGYFPMGLSLERIMTELPSIGLRDDVWPKFLRGNALRVLGLDD